MRIKNLVFWLSIFVPVLFVFKNFFVPGPLAWGDAPHFYPEGLKELPFEPIAWTNRGESFGGVNRFIFLWPIMFIYGVVGNYVGNDWTIRLLFYFPSITLSVVGIYLLIKYLKLSSVARFFSVLTYILSTYYLLLVDGGQVGVALAYGLFPLVLLFLKRLLDKPSLKSFYPAIIFSFVLTIADPRVAAISIFTILLWQILDSKFRNLSLLIPLTLILAALSMYWIYPLIKNTGLESQASVGSTNIRWYHPVTLFSPHWPDNLFGQINKPPIYFFGIPVLIFLGILLRRDRKSVTFGILFIVFTALAVGIPLVTTLPFGFAFRDSTKFFIPLILFAGILISRAVEVIQSKSKSKVAPILVYGYLLILAYPAFMGRMNFNLASRQPSGDLQKIYENLKADSGFYRTVWFPEKHPLAYETSNNPAIDAKDLAKFWPFAQMNAGEDVFNFLNNENFIDWFRVLGIKYLVLSGNPREISKSEKDQKDWLTINRLIDTNKDLQKIDWGTSVPIYKVADTYPRFFAVKKLVGVIGPPLVSSAQYLVPSIYFEDGKWDPHLLGGKDPTSVELLFNGTDEADLAMSFLQKYFVSSVDATKNEWAIYFHEQYLKYKYELLTRGVKFTDFDYGKGISFSTEKGEKMEFKFNVPESGNYVFIQRTMQPSDNESILEWKVKELSLQKGNHAEMIENDSDLTIFNVAALIPKKDFNEAEKLADTFVNHFKVVKTGELNFNEEYVPVDMEKWGTLKYRFSMPEGYRWLIFSDNYDKLWKMKQGDIYHVSVPVYSMINGFYAEDKWTKLSVEFKGQENVRWGIYWTVISILVLSIIYLWFSTKEKLEIKKS